MAIRRMYNMLDKIGNNGNVRADEVTVVKQQVKKPQDKPPSLLKRAEVILVNSVAGAMIMLDGQIVPAGQATDQPLRVGDSVWVMSTSDGAIVILGAA